MVNKVFYILVILLMGLNTKAQQGITGSVKDVESRPVTGATAHLLNTQKFAVSNSDGKFSIDGVSAGTYTIELSAIGFATKASEITVKEKENISFDFQLQNALIQLEAVTVTADNAVTLTGIFCSNSSFFSAVTVTASN